MICARTPSPPVEPVAPLPADRWHGAACEAPIRQQRTSLGSWAGWFEWAAEAAWLGPRAEQAVRYFVVAAVTINVLVFPFVLAFHGPVCLCRKRGNALPQTWSAGPVSLHREARRGLLKFRLYILGQTAAWVGLAGHIEPFPKHRPVGEGIEGSPPIWYVLLLWCDAMWRTTPFPPCGLSAPG